MTLLDIKNQRRSLVKPYYFDSIAQDFSPANAIKDVLTKALTQQINPALPITIHDKATNKSVNIDEISDMLINEYYNTLADPINEQYTQDFLNQTMVYFQKNSGLNIHHIFSIQDALKEQLPLYTTGATYTPQTDIIPVSKEFMGGYASREKLFVSFAFYAKPNTLGVYFKTADDFTKFQEYFQRNIQVISAALTTNVNALCNNFQQLTLTDKLTESIMLRNDPSEGNEPNSFVRLLMMNIMNYAYKDQNTQEYMGIMPFTLEKLIIPDSIVFINIDEHSKSSTRAISNEWTIISNSLATKPKIISNKKLQKLTTSTRRIQKIKQRSYIAANQPEKASRAKRSIFSKRPPTPLKTTKMLKQIIDKMNHVNMSQNSFKQVKKSYQRPNRRDPDNWNLAGKLVSTKYKPDLHIYLDTSGSISKDNYEDAVKTCITIAKKLNINLYFNSFSHVLSQEHLIETKNKSVSQIFKEFEKVPKVSGGTQYTNIWQYINRSKKRKRELSLVITDFEYIAPSYYIEHPTNLYYMACSNMNWDYIVSSTKRFINSMSHNDPNIRKKVLL